MIVAGLPAGGWLARFVQELNGFLLVLAGGRLYRLHNSMEKLLSLKRSKPVALLMIGLAGSHPRSGFAGGELRGTSDLRRLGVIVILLLAGLSNFAANAGGWKQDRFLITFWCPPPATDENLARVAREGFNLTWTPEAGLDVAQRHGLRAMLLSDLLKPEILEDTAKRAELDALIQRVKKHPALEAYHLTDEPGSGAFPGLGKLVAYLRERDPAHYAYINLYPTYANEQQLGVSADAAERAKVGYPTDFAGVDTSDKTVLRYREHVKQFIEIVKPDLISYDHYHFLKTEPDGKLSDGKQYFLNLGLIRLAALEANKPFLNIIQANTIEKHWRLPNGNELRWLVCTTMAYGGRGISYFTYWGPPAYNGLYVDGKPMPLLKDVVALNQELAAFGPALMELDSLGAYQTTPLPYGAEAIPTNCPVQMAGAGEFVLGVFGKSGQPTAFMIVNRNYREPAAAAVTVSIPGRHIQELNRAAGGWLPVQNLRDSHPVKLKVKLAPGDGRLFRVTP
jgi:hypothetical protein